MVRKEKVKKTICVLLMVFFVTLSFPIEAVASTPNATTFPTLESGVFDATRGDYVVNVKNMTTWVIAEVKFGEHSLLYRLSNGDNVIPLQFGNGKYNINIYIREKEDVYHVAKMVTIVVKNNEISLDDFTKSSVIVNFDNSKEILSQKSKFIKADMSDEEKTQAIYKYIVNNFSYDLNQEPDNILGPGYIPNPDKAWREKKGVCYEFSVIFAVIARSENIPTKLIMGDYIPTNEYHAWVEVYINGKWTLIDPTLKNYGNNQRYLATKYY